MQRCVAAWASGVSSAAESETEKKTDGERASASRWSVTHSTSAFW